MPLHTKKTLRTALIVVGCLAAVTANFLDLNLDSTWLQFFLGMGIVLWGCYFWTELKNRSRWFMLWGFLAPIGLFGISLLKDKSLKSGLASEEKGI